MKHALKIILLIALFMEGHFALANLPGGGTGAGPAVGLTDNGDGTVTMSNGIVAIHISKTSGVINQINYTFNNTGSSQTLNLLSGGYDGGQFYWEDSINENLTFSYAVVTDPANNGGNYGEVALTTTTVANILMEVHYSLLRGSSGFYVTPIFSHRSTDGAFTMAECRDNIYAGAIFNWMSVDAARNRLMEVSGGSAVGVQGAPVEVSLWTNGIYSGQYEDKYKYSADFGNQQVYGWSSVGAGGENVGLWNIQASMEYHQNGPMKRDLMEHIGTTILNMLNSSHYGGGANDCHFGAGEVWTKVDGPYFIYCNNVTNTLTGMYPASQALYADAQAQALAEEGVDTNGQPTGAVGTWPYVWFTNANYAPASGRGTVTGQLVINDTNNPSASPAGLWVGVMQQPTTISNVYDFQAWMKNYQFWVKSDAEGNFTIPNVIAGANYTLYAFGPGAAGTFQSQNLAGGNPPNTINLPASPFSITVTAGATNNLGTVTWTPTRVGPTVFEIGYPSRTGQNKFRHGEDYWVSEIYTNPAYPSPVWGKFLEYPFDFPNGPNYIVGQSRWTTDWNYVQPCVVTGTGLYDDSSSTITFNLSSTPSGTASFYIALCSDYQGALEISVNGTQIAGANGYDPSYSGSGSECDTTIREGVNANFSDNRINFSAGLLHSGQNTINVYMRQTGKQNGNGYFADHAMYDYIRLELTGYVPPPPTSVSAYAGNNCNLICWPATPGATSYNLFSTTTSGSGYSLIATGVTGPVCGSGTNNATYLDTNAVNGTTYYYVVQSVNPNGSSVNSPQSSGVTPSAAWSLTAPAAPGGLTVTGVGHHSVTLNWNPSAGANYYSIYRSTWFNNGGGASNLLGTIILSNTNTGTSFTDTSPTDGSIYTYFVTASSTGGTSSNSFQVAAVALPAPPASAPAGFGGGFVQTTNVVLGWSAVPGAVGYVISRATSFHGPYVLQQSVTETIYTNFGVTPGAYYYQVNAVNAGGVSAGTATLVSPTTVNILGDGGPGSLRQAAASASPGSTLTFAPGLSGQIMVLTNGPIILSNNITIDASALANGIQINGNQQSPIFEVGSNVTVVLNDITITNGAGLPQVPFSAGVEVHYSDSTLTLNNCSVVGNTGAFEGGGLYNIGTTFINECTFAGNSASKGGGIYNDGSLTLSQSTVSGNAATSTGGGVQSYFGSVTLSNSIVAGNTAPAATNLSLLTFTALGANLTNGNPQLAALGNYGGPAPTMPPLPGSPATDGCTNGASFAADQRGFARVAGPFADIGAVEAGDAVPGYNYTVVTTTNDFLNGLTNDGVSLRSAAAFAPATAMITFAPALSGQTIVLTNGQIVLSTNAWIDGLGPANGIQISGNNASCIFNISSNASATFTSLTLRNGNGGGDDGGALYNAGNTVMNYCTFTANSTGSGGAIKNASGSLILNECTLNGNTAQGGGGGGIVNYASLNLNACTLTGNSSPGYGGALYSEVGGHVTLDNTIAAGNSGNDIYNNGTLTLVSSNMVQSIVGSSSGTTPINASPQLAALGSYGGLTPVMPPLAGSPAINAGDDSITNGFATDQRGYPRLAGAHVDIGAVEGVYVTSLGKLTSVARGGGSLQFGFTNVTDANLPVFTTTNLSLPFSEWTPIGFAIENPAGSGQYQFTDPAATNYPQRFYLVKSP